MTERARLTAIYRYPVKGLSAEPLNEVAVAVGETLPFDRAYAIEIGAGRFDAAAPRSVPKVNFLMLMRHAALAELQTRFDPADQTLSIARDGRRVVSASLATPVGRAIIGQFFAEFLKDELHGVPHVVHAEGHAHTDETTKCVHIVNRQTAQELERLAGQPIDLVRFRPNLVVEGFEPSSEFDWVGRTLQIGEVALEVFERTERCAATNVNPATGRRDLDLPALIKRHWGHRDFGVYARILNAGRLRTGDACYLI